MTQNSIGRFAFLCAFFLLSLFYSKAQTAPSGYPYRKAQWVYLQRTVNHFMSPPDTTWSLYTVCECGDSTWNNQTYMKVGAIGYGNSYWFYRKSNDTIYGNLFISAFPIDYVESDYGATQNSELSSLHDIVLNTWNTTLLNGEIKKVFEVQNQSISLRDTVIEDLGYYTRPWYQVSYTGSAPDYTRLVYFRDSSSLLYYYPHPKFNPNFISPCPSFATSLTPDIDNNTTIWFDYQLRAINININQNFNGLTLSIFNALGKKIIEYKIQNNHTLIPINDFTEGIYFYQLNGQKKNKAGKFLITE